MIRSGHGILMTAALLAVASCGGDDGPELPFGDTTLVVVVNPAENEGNTAPTPAFVGNELAGIDIDAEPGGADTTDDTGLVVLGDVGAGDLDLVFAGAATLPATIAADGNIDDVAVAYDGAQVGLYEGFPIRYAASGEVITIATDGDATEALSTDDTIVFFEDGIHVGNLGTSSRISSCGSDERAGSSAASSHVLLQRHRGRAQHARPTWPMP